MYRLVTLWVSLRWEESSLEDSWASGAEFWESSMV